MTKQPARNVEAVEIPALDGGYHAFYNPGGPGPEPFAGVRYTAPGPPVLEPVTIALDDPMRVDRDARRAAPSIWMIIVIMVVGGVVVLTATVLVRRFTGHHRRA